MLDKSLYRLYVSPNIFIQEASPFILSFDIKSTMATDMLLPVILSELVDSDDEKPRRTKTREWIKRRHQLGSFQNIIKELIVEDRYAFKEMFQMSVQRLRNCFKAYLRPYFSRIFFAAVQAHFDLMFVIFLLLLFFRAFQFS